MIKKGNRKKTSYVIGRGGINENQRIGNIEINIRCCI